MARILVLGAVVIVVIAAAFFVVRWARAGDHGEEEEAQQGGREQAPARPRREDGDDWPADDYRSPHPIRGKYAAPSPGVRSGGSRRPQEAGYGTQDGYAGYDQQPADRGGYQAGDAYPPAAASAQSATARYATGTGGYDGAATAQTAYQPAPTPDGYAGSGGYPQQSYGSGGYPAGGGYGTERASAREPVGYGPDGGYGGGQASASGYKEADRGYNGANGYGSSGEYGTGEYGGGSGYGPGAGSGAASGGYGPGPAAPGSGYGPGPGAANGGGYGPGPSAPSGGGPGPDAGYTSGQGYGPSGGYQAQSGPGPGDGPRGARAALPASEDRKQDDDDGKKKSRRFGLRRHDDEEFWPDDEVSDEDYWASVATERSLPSTGGPAASPPALPAATERGQAGRLSGDPRQAQRPGGVPSTGSVRFGGDDPRERRAPDPYEQSRGPYQPHPYGERRDDPYGRGRR
jgi:hypothetical protein